MAITQFTDCIYLTSGIFYPGSGCSPADGLPYARFTESWGIRYSSPDPTWALSTSGPFLAGYISSGTNYGPGNILACGCISIGTTEFVTSNGNLGRILKMASTGNNAFTAETGTTNRYMVLESRRTGRTGSARNAQISLGGDASDNGEIFFMTAPAGSDVSSRMLINSVGDIGINQGTPSYKLHVNGTFYAAGSSIDYKQSICNYNTDSCMFMKLKPVTYQYKEEYCHLGKELKSGTQIGLIAEEVAETYPELAILVNEEENKVVRNVDYEKLSVILLSEVQKLRREVDDLKHKQ
jgi:hypothetical protein